VSGSGAVSGRPRSGNGAESGCHKNRLER